MKSPSVDPFFHAYIRVVLPLNCLPYGGITRADS